MTLTTHPRPLELLAPARDVNVGIQAILHGADAVYIGAPSHGARAKAVNTIDDIARLVQFAAPYGVKVYVTVNTIIYDDELEQVRRMIYELYAIGVDALIVQDMALLHMSLPPIALHASTQCDTRTPAKARMLEQAGFSQIVVARELSLTELREVCQAVDVPIEAFVHGALCVSYSGDCRASLLATGRSANRGCCAQMCRLPYELIDGAGRSHGRRHFLSLRDMQRIDSLADMADAGVSSFKIEGRLKDAEYVKEVTAAYRQALDAIIDANPDRYCRASLGRCTYTFAPSTDRCFNRGYTDYFLRSTSPTSPMSTPLSPKAIGIRAAKVAACSANTLTITDVSTELNNGDGIAYITPAGEVGGFRINRAEPRRLVLAQPVDIPVGTTLYRSYDRLRNDMLAGDTATRLIPIALTLRAVAPDRVALDALVEGIITPVSVTADADIQPASKPDNGYRERTLAKLGNTRYTLASLDDRLGGVFIPASQLTSLRRALTDAIDATLLARRVTDRRRNPQSAIELPSDALTHHDNVANSLARDFYTEAGATTIEPATEVRLPRDDEDFTVMECRYCLRRELGACLRKGGAARLPEPLTLRAEGIAYRLDFDCRRCRMSVIRPAR